MSIQTPISGINAAKFSSLANRIRLEASPSGMVEAACLVTASADDPPLAGSRPRRWRRSRRIVATKTAMNGLAKLPDHAMPPVLAGYGGLKRPPATSVRPMGIVKLHLGDKPSVGMTLEPMELKLQSSGAEKPANLGFLIHPPGDIGFARNADGIALILIAESAKQVIKLVIHLGNPG